jgi:hypothetical protein
VLVHVFGYVYELWLVWILEEHVKELMYKSVLGQYEIPKCIGVVINLVSILYICI